MARPYSRSYDLADEDTNGYVAAATGATTPLTLITTSVGDGVARKVTVTSAANLAAITFTVTGTDADGVAQTEAITGPGATTVTGSKFFLTVTEVAISATLGANEADVGWADEFVTPTYPINWRASEASVSIVRTGTINWTLRQTFDELAPSATYPAGPSSATLTWSSSTDTGVVGVTTSAITNYDKPATALQLLGNSYSTGAELAWQIVQADM